MPVAHDPIPESFDQARPLLRLRPLGATPLALRATLLTNAGGGPADLDAAVPIIADLRIGAFLDLPTADVAVTSAGLERWGAPLEAVLGAARSNLTAAPAPQRVGRAAYVDDRGFTAAALTEPHLLRTVHSAERLFVIVPTQQHLIVADADDPAAVAEALDLAGQAISQDTRLASRTPLLLGPDGWQAAELPDTPHGRTVRHLFDNRTYAEARDLVKAAHERLGIDDVLVPAYQAAREATGNTTSMTSLVDDEGVRTFLPLADAVALVRVDGSPPVAVPMERLRAVPGLATPVPGLLPVHLEVGRFPHELVP